LARGFVGMRSDCSNAEGLSSVETSVYYQ